MSELDLDEACLGNNMPKFILHLINRLLYGFNKPSDLNSYDKSLQQVRFDLGVNEGYWSGSAMIEEGKRKVSW